VLAAPPALAAPQVNGEFSVSGLGTYNALTTGPDGNIWVTLDDATNNVAKITPAGNVQQFNLPDVTSPVGITVVGDNLWVTQNGGVARFSPGDPTGTDTAFPVTGLNTPHAIVRGPDGNLWTASGTHVFRILPSAPGTIGDFTQVTDARGIAAGGDGNIWVADAGGQRIVSLTTAGTPAPGSPYSVAGGGPQGIAAGLGTQMAFTDPLSGPPHRLGRITPGGVPQFTPIATSDPFGITFAADGAYWTGRFSTNNIGRLTPNGQFTQLGGFSANAGPRQLAPGPGNTLWVTLQTADKVARVTGVGPTPPPPPSGCTDNEFTFGKAKKNKKKGTAKLTVEVPCAGDLELAKTKKVKADDEVAEADGEEKLTVKPKGKARKRLNKKGKAKVKAEVTYTPEGGEPNTQTKRVKLVRR